MNKLLNILLLNKLSKQKGGVTPTGTLSITENVERSIILSSMQRESDIPLPWREESRPQPVLRQEQPS